MIAVVWTSQIDFIQDLGEGFQNFGSRVLSVCDDIPGC